MIIVYTQLYITFRNNYMFRLYIYSCHQAKYKTLDQKTIKYNTVQLWGRDLICISMCSCTKLYKIHENMWRLQEMSCLKINTSRAYIHQYQNLKRNYMF